jgi:putative membrane protein
LTAPLSFSERTLAILFVRHLKKNSPPDHSNFCQDFSLKLFHGRDNLRHNHSMKKISTLIAALFPASPLFAADFPPAPVPSWHATTLLEAIGNVLIFAAIGIFAAIVGYKVFDKCTPGDLQREIIEHKNIAAAIVAAAVILGVSIIIAASMLG